MLTAALSWWLCHRDGGAYVGVGLFSNEAKWSAGQAMSVVRLKATKLSRRCGMTLRATASQADSGANGNGYGCFVSSVQDAMRDAGDCLR